MNFQTDSKISASLDADLRTYADLYEEEGHGAIPVELLIPAMLGCFMRADRVFQRARRRDHLARASTTVA